MTNQVTMYEETPTRTQLQEMQFNEDMNLSEKVWQEGVLVHPFIGWWSMETRLKASDVGLENVKADLVKLGHKRMISKTEKNKFANIRTKVSNLLNEYGFNFLFLRGPFYVRNENLQTVIEGTGTQKGLNGFKKEFEELTEVFLNRYDEFQKTWLEENKEYRHILENYYPSVDEIRPKFRFRYRIYKVRDSVNDVEYAQGAEINDGDYMDWIAESINDLRTEVIMKVNKIRDTITEKGIDNRVYTRIQKLRDKVIALDMTKDDVLRDAIEELYKNPTVEQVKNVTDKAQKLSIHEVRELYI